MAREINLATGELAGGAEDLQKICGPREAGNPEWMFGGIEGPFVVKRGGIFRLFFSVWTRRYETGVMTTPTPLGRWRLTPSSPIFGTRKRRYREKQAQEGGYAHLRYDDTPDPFVEVGDCAVFTGPDGGDWLGCHYFLQGTQPIPVSPIPEYYDTTPQLGIERSLQHRSSGPISRGWYACPFVDLDEAHDTHWERSLGQAEMTPWTSDKIESARGWLLLITRGRGGAKRRHAARRALQSFP